MQQKLIAEAFGTFALALTVLATLNTGMSAVSTPVAAGLVLGLFVYTIGAKSGCHINPAVTLGLWSINKIKTNDAISYIIAQVLGGLIAFGLASAMLGGGFSLGMVPESMNIFLAELIGATLFTFGIAAVVSGPVHGHMSGLVIGGSLLLGITIAAALGSAGIINPAVALALGSLNLSYALGSIAGAMLGFNFYKYIN
ncbi:MAG: aquaporin [Patescibacteria group bacterium]